ncbi:MAG: F0F1 ATP synthase subunit A [Endomicrobium sp.]|jgi:F-type H+-transporting ATPase subunit a|nr:F0F1 ATP synthase subunit A [Endomicrobium sp.]
MHLRPEVLFFVAGFPITNTVVATIITDVIIIMIVVILSKVIAIAPGNIQNVIETVVDYFNKTAEEIAGERAVFIYPWITSFFIFILISNLVAQFPGFETIKFRPTFNDGNEVSFFRAATSDLNVTLALSVISIIVTNYLGIRYKGIKAYARRFLSFKIFPVFLFVGILEFTNEFTKIISFSFRLFGNILAGEKVLMTMYKLLPIGFPLPFMMLELMVAIVQAVVFSMLTMVFMHIMTDKSH